MLMSFAGFVLGEQVEAGKPWPLLGTGDLALGDADNLVEPFSSCLGRDHAREHRSPIHRGFVRAGDGQRSDGASPGGAQRAPRTGPHCDRLRAVLHGPGVPWDTEAV